MQFSELIYRPISYVSILDYPSTIARSEAVRLTKACARWSVERLVRRIRTVCRNRCQKSLIAPTRLRFGAFAFLSVRW
jgi:hypothetical protein